MDEITAAVAEAAAALAKIQNLSAAERSRLQRLGFQSPASSSLHSLGLAARHAHEALAIWLATLKDCQEFARNPYSGKVCRLEIGQPIPEGWEPATPAQWQAHQEDNFWALRQENQRSDRYE